MKKVLFLLLVVFSSFYAKAMNTGSYYQISQVYVWGDYTGGVIKILLKTPNQDTVSHCPAGFWIDDVNDKNASVYSTALAAYHSNSKVRVYADHNKDWSGTSSKDCYIQLIILEPK
jgi:hypothetical protein